jgi:Ca-activated chloride channel homolog
VTQLQALHFLRPEWLWLLAAAGLLYFLVRRREDVAKSWRQMIAPELLDHLIIGAKKRWRFRPLHAVTLGIVLGAIGMAGPTWTREQPPFTEDKAPLVIAIDLSREMDAVDVAPTRLERIKLKIADLMKLRRGSRTAIFVYSGSAHNVAPLTTDEGIIEMYVQSLASDLLGPGKKDTAGALRKVDSFLKDETVPGTILFMTSGVERAAFPTFMQHQNNRHQALVLAVGTAEGGPIRTRSGEFLEESGRRVFSKLDVAELKALKSTGVPVSTATLDDEDLKWVQRKAQSHLQAVQENDANVRWSDQGYWLVIPIAVLGALWFRRGWTVRSAVTPLAFLVLLPARPAHALDFHFIDLWMTPDQQGRYFSERGDYKTAAERFQDHMWKGYALSRQHDYAAALNEFSLIDSPESWFNQGDVLALSGKYKEAVKAFGEALRERPGWRVAEENLALVQALIPKQKKPDDDQVEDPSLKPDQVKFDEKGKKGKKGQVNIGKEEMAEVWMRNIQTSPADFLRRKFAIENVEGRRR